MKVGDTIVTIDGKAIKNGDELVADIASRKPGTKIAVGFIRNGKKQEASITVADRAKLFAARLGDEDENNDKAGPKESKLGLTVRTVTQDMADRLDVPAGKGVIVQDVKSGSFAEDVGLARGDVILEINKQPVNNEDEFQQRRRHIEERPGRGLPGPAKGRWPGGWNHLPGRYTSVTEDWP